MGKAIKGNPAGRIAMGAFKLIAVIEQTGAYLDFLHQPGGHVGPGAGGVFEHRAEAVCRPARLTGPVPTLDYTCCAIFSAAPR